MCESQSGEIILIGTAHVSPESIKEVKQIIENEKPDAVAVELCNKRYKALMGEIEEVSILDVIKRGDAYLSLFQIILSYFQRKIGEKFGVKPGDEMLAAIKKAKEINAKIYLIDRDVSITFKRLWNSISFFEKIKLFMQIIKGLFAKDKINIDKVLREERTLENLIYEFKKVSPSAAKVLIDERDAYMASNLIELSKKHKKIVAVVGAGHKKGIEKFLKDPAKIPSIDELLAVKKSKIKLHYVFFALLLAFILFMALSLPVKVLLKAFAYWFLINGILAALGAFIAGAHPLSIVAAFSCAWFTSLNPFIAAGWVSGIVEAWIRKPTFKDLKNMTKVSNLSELFKNKAFRVLLVAALTNIGSTIGTFLAAYFIFKTMKMDFMIILKKKVSSLGLI